MIFLSSRKDLYLRKMEEKMVPKALDLRPSRALFRSCRLEKLALWYCNPSAISCPIWHSTDADVPGESSETDPSPWKSFSFLRTRRRVSSKAFWRVESSLADHVPIMLPAWCSWFQLSLARFKSFFEIKQIWSVGFFSK